MKVPGKHRYAAPLLTVALVLAVAVFAYPHDTQIFRAMQSLSIRAGKFHVIREFLEMFRPFGQADVILVIAAGMGLCGARRRALHIILALAVMSLLIWPVKVGVGRERPAFKNFQSFPSGDVATAAAFVTPLVGLSYWMAPAAVFGTGGVALERVYYGRHYASDALAGAGFGVLSAVIAMAILRRWRWRPKRCWFVLAGLLLMVTPLIASLLRSRGAPYLFDVLRVWGPFGAFLISARLIPGLIRKRRTKTGLPPRPFSSGGVGVQMLLVASIAGGFMLLVTPWFMPVFGLRLPLVTMGLITLAMARSVWRLNRKKRGEAIPAVTLMGLVCALLSTGLALLPAFLAYRDSVLTF
ncbi:MAG: phosphatase PAP2 family protein [bacterium]